MKNNKIRIVAIAVVIILVVCGVIYKFGACRPEIRHVLLVSVDTCRSDFVGCYGYPYETTPNIDALAEQGIMCKNTYTPVPLTLPAHSSMLTGTNPPYHGIHNNLDYVLSDFNVTLAEILKENGFTTGAAISAFVLDSDFGISQGFDFYDDTFKVEHKAGSVSERKGDETTEVAVEWLKNRKDEKTFFFLHYYDPHTEYAPPEPFASKFADKKFGEYAGEIAFADHCIGRVIQTLKDIGIYDSTLIVVTGDHGEMLGEHGEPAHSYFIYQGALKVPLVFKVPGYNKGMVISEITGLVDIVPTICGLLGIEYPQSVAGVDLSSAFKTGNTGLDQRYLYCESLTPTTYSANSLLGVVNDKYKYIQTTRPELYDLVNDPHETNNLVKAESQRARVMQDWLKQILDEQVRRDTGDSKMDLDKSAIRRIESLGYVAGGVDEDYTFDQTKDDPKDVISVYLDSAKAGEYIDSKEYDKAIEMCQKMVHDRPHFVKGYLDIAKIACELKDFAAAVEPLRKAVELKPENIDAQANLGVTLQKLGNYDEALTHFQKAAELRPEKAEVHSNLSLALLKLDRMDEATEEGNKALQIDPLLPEANSTMATILVKEGKVDGAIKYYQKALEAAPDNIAIRNELALLYYNQKDFENAADNFRKSLEVDPTQKEICNNLGSIYAESGNESEAVEFYSKSLSMEPGQLEVMNAIGAIYLKLKETDKALEIYLSSLEIKSDQPVICGIIGSIYQNKNLNEKAIEYFLKALTIKQDMPNVLRSIAESYFQEKQYASAIHYWLELIKLEPSSAEPMNNLAWCKSVYNDREFYDPDGALKYALKANELTEYKNISFLDTLSVAYAANKNFDKAVETIEKAIKLENNVNNSGVLEELNKHRQLFIAAKPYTEENIKE